MKRKMQIIEDDSDILEVLILIFEGAGFEVMACTDAAPILEEDFIPPDIFILDRNLSGKDGVDVIRMLKSREATRQIPIIMVSASTKAKPLALATGADEFVEKPFKVRQLVALAERYLTAIAFCLMTSFANLITW